MGAVGAGERGRVREEGVAVEGEEMARGGFRRRARRGWPLENRSGP
jgi:hypothetical protein